MAIRTKHGREFCDTTHSVRLLMARFPIHQLKMLWIYTRSIVADVVNGHLFWKLSDKQHECDSMDWPNKFPTEHQFHVPITGIQLWSSPLPATTRFDNHHSQNPIDGLPPSIAETLGVEMRGFSTDIALCFHRQKNSPPRKVMSAHDEPQFLKGCEMSGVIMLRATLRQSNITQP